MGLNETPSGERIHIGFFGRRNAGKSSLVNAGISDYEKGNVTDGKTAIKRLRAKHGI